MRTRSFGIAMICAVLVLAGSAATPPAASAQCSMMGGSGHDHATGSGHAASNLSAAQKQHRQSIDRLLADDTGRAMLVEALLKDDAFMRTLIPRLAMVPEWRAMAAERPAPTKTAVYSCPMHHEVTSTKPGRCPKCGMELVRTPESRR